MLRDLVCFSITSVIGFHGNIERWGISQLVISLFSSWEISILEYFHIIQLDMSEYARYNVPRLICPFPL